MRRSREYAERYAVQLNRRLGFGKDGTVWQTDSRNALKIFHAAEVFSREVRVYRRLLERGVSDVCGHNVPQIVRADDELLALEMTIVRRPFVLDFGSAYLDGSAPEFPPEIMEEWLTERREMFGSGWARVARVLSALRAMGIELTDVHPGNISFEDH